MSEQPTVVVIGGGYGGVSVAKALDDVANVVLVEPKDAFQHNIAALRGLVDPEWTARTFLPYDALLTRGTVIRDRAAEVDQHGALLASGTRLHADYLVLATGSTYPFPAKTDRADSAAAIAHYHEMYANLALAETVMLVGAGAVGLELAGEIAAAWPDKHIVMVDVADEVLPGRFDPRVREDINRQLDELKVTRLLGSPLAAEPDTQPGDLLSFTVDTLEGRSISADIWFRCYGVAPVTDYLAGDLPRARTADGYLVVTPELLVDGFQHVYAVGDIASLDVNKAAVAARQAAVVAANIRAQIEGSDERATYAVAPPSIILPLGPSGGAGQLGTTGEIISAEYVSKIKGTDLMIDRYAEMLNLPPANR